MSDFYAALHQPNAFLWIGHRGDGVNGKSPYIENTIPSFEKAIALGADALEFDIQMTKDQELVLFHDDTIGPQHSPQLVSETSIPALRLDQVQALRLGHSNDSVPVLREFFLRFKDKTLFYCELKHHPNLGSDYHDTMARRFMSLIQELGIASRCLIVSFNRSLLKTCAQIDDTLAYGLNLSKTDEPNPLDEIPLACLCPVFSHHESLIPSTWDGAVIPYNVNCTTDIQTCLSLGYSGATTDDLSLKGMIKRHTDA